MRILLSLLFASLCSAQTPLRLERTIALPGVNGRIDHLAADSTGSRVFIAALGNNTLEVIDAAAGKRLQTVRGLNEPQGVLYLAANGRVYVANGQTGKLQVYDGKTLQPAGALELGEDADNVRYDAASGRVWVGHGNGVLGAVDPAGPKVTGSIKLDAHPESFQLEKGGPRIFVNVPKANQIAVVDRAKQTVLAKWPMPAGSANYPMALDEANRRLFAGCRKPAQIAILDTQTGKITAKFDCVGDTDDVFFDAARKRLYVIGGEGFVDVFAQKDADHYTRIAHIPTAAGARTGLFVPDMNRLFVAVPHRGAQGAEIRVFVAE